MRSILVLALLAAACGGRTQLRGTAGASSDGGTTQDGAPLPSTDGVVARACAPNDGPALDFSFGTSGLSCVNPSTGPNAVIIELWDPLPAGPGTFQVGDGSFPSGSGAFVCNATGCSAAASGTLVLTEFSTVASGWYSLTTPDGNVVSASFSKLPRCDNVVTCG